MNWEEIKMLMDKYEARHELEFIRVTLYLDDSGIVHHNYRDEEVKLFEFINIKDLKSKLQN